MFAYGPADATVIPKPRHLLVLSFWFGLILVVLEKRPLYGCSGGGSLNIRVAVSRGGSNRRRVSCVGDRRN